MNIPFKKAIFLPVLLIMLSCNHENSNVNTIISIKTTLGDIKIKLYDGTPVHRDNFIKLVKSGFYDGVSFHRVIKDFMIQAGDPATKTDPVRNMPDSLSNYTIPSEININYFHKKGALAAARQGTDVNPEMRSSGTQFYIVEGVKYTDDELNQVQQRINSSIKQTLFDRLMRETADSIRLSGKSISDDSEIQQIASLKMYHYLTSNKDYTFSEEQRNVYKTIGGTPFLDGTYTVFGEVTEGLDVVDKIATVQTDTNDRPLSDIKIIRMKIEKY